MDFTGLLKIMTSKGASDLFITAGIAPSIKVHGKLETVTQTVLGPAQAREVVLSIMTEKQRREFEFTGIACQDIARVQVVGGDRCEMGDLHRFSDLKGQCLERVRVVSSDLVRFDK